MPKIRVWPGTKFTPWLAVASRNGIDPEKKLGRGRQKIPLVMKRGRWLSRKKTQKNLSSV